MSRPFSATAWRQLLSTLLAATVCGCAAGSPTMIELQRVKSGALEVVLLSDHAAIRHGKDTFIVEFRSAPRGSLIDVGQVRATATMPMPGMAMFGNVDLQRTGTPGRYTASSDFGMAGTWRMTLQWTESIGSGTVSFAGTVQ